MSNPAEKHRVPHSCGSPARTWRSRMLAAGSVADGLLACVQTFCDTLSDARRGWLEGVHPWGGGRRHRSWRGGRRDVRGTAGTPEQYFKRKANSSLDKKL